MVVDTQNKLLPNLVSDHQPVQASKPAASAAASVVAAVVSGAASEATEVELATGVDLVTEAVLVGEEALATKAVVVSEDVEASQMARRHQMLQVDPAAQGEVAASVVGTELDQQTVLEDLNTVIVAAMGTVLEVIEITAVVQAELLGLTAAEIRGA